jgi:hypothetical protein
MKKWSVFWTGIGLLSAACLYSGCAPLPYQEAGYVATEIIIVHVPEPEPWPDTIVHAPPPPERHQPLSKPARGKGPRVKTPRPDRSGGREEVGPRRNETRPPPSREPQRQTKRSVVKRS